MSTGYFHRVTSQMATRFWINNPSAEEMEEAIAAGAVSCTTNPTYGAKLLKSEPDYIYPIIDRVITETPDDDEAADRVCEAVSARLLAGFLPLYERSRGKSGFVTLQSDPRKDEDANELIREALRYRALGPNFMTKVPVTKAGLEAMEVLIAENIPLCATEVFSLAQAASVCDLYGNVTKKTGKRPPIYITHITGIFDEYLANVVERDRIDISSEALGWAGATVARREYLLLMERGCRGTLLGGGARSTRHFTDFVGGEVQITINWSTARELIDTNPPVVDRMLLKTPPEIDRELSDKLSDFRMASGIDALSVEEYAGFGPVQFFRNNFIAGYERLLSAISARRAMAPLAVAGRR